MHRGVIPGPSVRPSLGRAEWPAIIVGSNKGTKMGQYHKLYNVTRKEFVHPHKIGNGLKLTEQCGFPGSTASALFLLVANSNGRGVGDAKPHPYVGRWAGDRVVVQGDYACEKDPGYIWDTDLESFTDISEGVRDMLEKEFETRIVPWPQ